MSNLLYPLAPESHNSPPDERILHNFFFETIPEETRNGEVMLVFAGRRKLKVKTINEQDSND